MTAELIERLERGETGWEVSDAVSNELTKLWAAYKAEDDFRERARLSLAFNKLHGVAFKHLMPDDLNCLEEIKHVTRTMATMDDAETGNRTFDIIAGLMRAVLALNRDVAELRAALLKAEAK